MLYAVSLQPLAFCQLPRYQLMRNENPSDEFMAIGIDDLRLSFNLAVVAM